MTVDSLLLPVLCDAVRVILSDHLVYLKSGVRAKLSDSFSSSLSDDQQEPDGDIHEYWPA